MTRKISGVVSSSSVSQSGRMDASYHLLVGEHRPVFDELMARLTAAQLFTLARRLPFYPLAAAVVMPLRQDTPTRRDFHAWLGALEDAVSASPGRRAEAAAYCAAAARGAVGALMAEVERLARQQVQSLEDAVALVTLASATESPHLRSALQQGYPVPPEAAEES